MTSIDLASNSALLQVAEKLAEQNALLGKVAIRGESAFIRYSAYADGTDFTETWSAGQNYIGHATGFEAPTDKEGYTWSLFASNIRETLTVTLHKDGWVNNTQIVEAIDLGENGSVFPSPKPECRDEYLNTGVVLTAATDGALVFTCEERPSIDLVIDIQVTEPLAVIGGSGVSSWNELLDKPFGEKGIVIEWDGTIEGKRFDIIIEDSYMPDLHLLKISDRPFTAEEWAQAIITRENGTTDTLSSVLLETSSYGNVCGHWDYTQDYKTELVSIFDNRYPIGDGWTTGSYNTSLTIGTYVAFNAEINKPEIIKVEFPTAVTLLDPKYLPDKYATRAEINETFNRFNLLENAIGGFPMEGTLVESINDRFVTLEAALGAYITDIDTLLGGDE